MALQLLLVIGLANVATGFIGYDCTAKGLNITTLSLTDVGNCNMDIVEPHTQEVYIQLMQLSDYDHVQVTQCKVEVDRTIYYCGMHSHVSAVQNGRKEYIREVGPVACSRLHQTGTLDLGNAFIDKLYVNTTNRRSATLAGSLTLDGRCAGAQYSDGYGSWENVVVQAAIRVTLVTKTVPIKRSANQILLPAGARCAAASGFCLDADGMESYWVATPADSCHFDRYDILYEGTAVRLTPKESQLAPDVYTVTTHETTFALAKSGEFSVCGYKLARTEHPKLFILETERGKTFKLRSKTSVDNLDIFAYVNSKFVYVERHIKTQLNQLYKDIMEQKCALEKQILQNALSLASVAPDEMATRIMKTPGYTAVVAGEVIHIIKCLPVQCKVRHVQTCYNELPVTYRNTSYFLLPRSRILTRTGTQRDCNELLPTMYRIHDTWYRTELKPVESLPPPIIQPLTRPTWKYVSPSSLATNGIYSGEDLDRLRNHIMFPVEKPSMLNTLARGAMGQSVPPGSISMMNLLDEGTIDQIAESAGKRIWKGFMNFGSASAGVLGVILILRLAKLVIDTIIHGYALHSIYGWSLHLLGAIWTSVTNLLLHLGKPTSSQPQQHIRGNQPIDEEGDKLTSEQSAVSDETTFTRVNRGENSEPQMYTYKGLREYLNIGKDHGHSDDK